MKKIILYATAGIGHKKAALAIKEAFDKKDEKDVLLVDALKYTSKLFKVSYCSIYLLLVRYFPLVWGFFYHILDNSFLYFFLRPIRRLTNKINSGKLVKFLLKEKPDTAIVTHFLALEVIANLKKRGLLQTRLIAVITDYISHTFWLSKHVDLYVVGSEYTKRDFIRRGIRPEIIKPLGIPCESAFSKKHDVATLKQKMNLEPGKETIFVLGGGFGVGPIKDLVLNLDKQKEDFQIIVVCGYNKKLFDSIKEIEQNAKHKLKAYGFVNNVDEFMAVSDVLVSKSGGISVTEALASGIPMIVVDPIPGQEMGNYNFLKESNAAVKIKDAQEVGKVVEDLIGSKKIEVLKKNIEKIKHTDSAERIVDETNK